jgi:GAF domain-containing protein
VDRTVLRRLAEIVQSDQPRAPRAKAAAELIRGVITARWVGIYSVVNDTVTNEAWSGPAAPAYPTFPVTEGLTGHALRTRSVALSNDVAHDPRYLVNQDDSGSELIVPVMLAGRSVGTLDTESDAIGAFGGAEITQCEDLAAALQSLWSAGDAQPDEHS